MGLTSATQRDLSRSRGALHVAGYRPKANTCFGPKPLKVPLPQNTAGAGAL
jgi:hypothetical protein